MIIITEPGISQALIDQIREHVEARGMHTRVTVGQHQAIIGCIGDDDLLREMALHLLPGVQSVVPVMKPYKLASRAFVPMGTTVRLGSGPGQTIGGDGVTVIAGPCSVESREMLFTTAMAVREAGAGVIRGGAFKPRTSPYAFQGMGRHGLELLAEVRSEVGLPVVTEVLDTRHVELVARHADMLQIGARNMQNFALLAEVGATQRPVLLKRGLSATVEELLMAAEYVLANGGRDVVLCERGIRTFERATRNTLDVAAIPVLKRETHLPVIVDPSHAGGSADLVAPLAFAAIAAGADGLIVEVHPSPADALSDGDQSLTLEQFERFMERLQPFADAAGRSIATRTQEAA